MARKLGQIIDEVHNLTDGFDFEAMLAEGRKFGVHYLFVPQMMEQMRDERRGIYKDPIALEILPTLSASAFPAMIQSALHSISARSIQFHLS